MSPDQGEMMKIAYVSTYLPKKCGIATYTDYLIHGIRKVDPVSKIKVIAEHGASQITQDKIEVIPCWDRDKDYVEVIISQAKDIDIIHIQHEYSIYKLDERLPNLLHRLNKDIKKIITIHCIRPAQFSEKGVVEEDFVARIAKLADEVIVHLPSQRRVLLRRGLSPSKIHLIPHGTELSDEDKVASRKRLGLPIEGKILLVFGFIKKHKCLHILLDVLSKIVERFKDMYLFVAGGLAPTASNEDKEYAEYLSKRIEELRIRENVIYPNRFFPNEDVPYLFGASDIVLFPYYEEDRSVSGSFHLAIGAKRPVIASRIPKFEELKKISDELLVLPYNVCGIAEVVTRIFDDHEFREYILERIDEYRRVTSWEAVARQHLKLYRK